MEDESSNKDLDNAFNEMLASDKDIYPDKDVIKFMCYQINCVHNLCVKVVLVQTSIFIVIKPLSKWTLDNTC